MNYADLSAAIQTTCEDAFTVDDLARFTKLAEQKIYTSVQLPSLRKNVTGAFAIGNKYLSLPTDFLSPFSLAVVDANGAYSFLIDKDVNFIREAYPTPTATGQPKYYAVFGPVSGTPTQLTLIVGPTPSANLVTELHYNSYPESIVTASTSWLGDNFDTVLLNAALCEAIRFQKGEKDMVDLYDKMFRESLSLLKNLGDGKLRTDTYRTPQVRSKPL